MNQQEEVYKNKKCGSCKGFLKWCRKRKSTNSCDKPACEKYEPRTLMDILIIGQPIVGQ